MNAFASVNTLYILLDGCVGILIQMWSPLRRIDEKNKPRPNKNKQRQNEIKENIRKQKQQARPHKTIQGHFQQTTYKERAQKTIKDTNRQNMTQKYK